MRTIGLDVHRHFAEIAILEGKEERQLRISTEPQALRDFARTLGPDDQVVLEATANTWPIADLLAERAGKVVVSNPLRTRAIADAKIKTDKVDARTLAQLLAADFIPQVWVPDLETRALRGRIAQHRALVQQRTRLRNQIHAALIRSLVSCPKSDLFGVAGRRWLAQVALAPHERAGVESALRLHDALEAEIALLDRELSQAALASPDARLLCTINGIGAVTALALVALIGPVARFSRPNKLVGYLGLDPTVRQSGDRPRPGKGYPCLLTFSSVGRERWRYSRVWTTRTTTTSAAETMRKPNQPFRTASGTCRSNRSSSEGAPFPMIATATTAIAIATAAPPVPGADIARSAGKYPSLPLTSQRPWGADETTPTAISTSATSPGPMAPPKPRIMSSPPIPSQITTPMAHPPCSATALADPRLAAACTTAAAPVATRRARSAVAISCG